MSFNCRDSNASNILELQQAEENFDLSLLSEFTLLLLVIYKPFAHSRYLSPLVSIETDILSQIGNPLVPDELIQRLAKCIQVASKLYELDLPPSIISTSDSDDQETAFTPEDTLIIEARFDPDFDRQAKGKIIHGTTAQIIEIGRERFGYWCLDLLFLMCSAEEKGNISILNLFIILNLL